MIIKDFQTFYKDTVISTMSEAKKIAQENSFQNIIVVAAKNQTNGRGRGGSFWAQPPIIPGTLTSESETFDSLENAISNLSEFPAVTLVFPYEKLSVPIEWVTQLVGCALYDTFQKLFVFVSTQLNLNSVKNNQFPYYLKWPNDFLYSKDLEKFKKISGILCETTTLKNKIEFFFIGIGINFFDYPHEYENKATSFIKSLIDYFEVSKISQLSMQKEFSKPFLKKYFLEFFARTLCEEIKEYLCISRPISQIKNLVLERSLPLGTFLSVDKNKYYGDFLGFQDDGALILKDVHVPIYSGDVSLNERVLTSLKNDFSNITIDVGNTRVHVSYLSQDGFQSYFHFPIHMMDKEENNHGKDRCKRKRTGE